MAGVGEPEAFEEDHGAGVGGYFKGFDLSEDVGEEEEEEVEDGDGRREREFLHFSRRRVVVVRGEKRERCNGDWSTCEMGMWTENARSVR